MLDKIDKILKEQKKPFEIEVNKQVENYICDLYAYRKFNLIAKDYFYIINLDKSDLDIQQMNDIHESNRKHANSFFKLPKALRGAIPNILTLFLTTKEIKLELISWVKENTRTLIGGEFHQIIIANLNQHSFYSQGQSYTYMKGAKHHFKKADPQNRSYYLVYELINGI